MIRSGLGWSAKDSYVAEEGLLHYVVVRVYLYGWLARRLRHALQTVATVTVSMIIATAWGCIDASIRRLQVRGLVYSLDELIITSHIIALLGFGVWRLERER